jgi:hypothetical protein
VSIGFVALCLAAAPQPDLPRLPPPAKPGEVEVAPPPRPAGVAPLLPGLPDVPTLPAPPFSLTAVPNGYQVSLNRQTAELLRDALGRVDEKDLAASLKKAAKDRKEANPDDDTARTLELLAFAAATQLPGFKKALAENMGPGGVVVTVTGLQAPAIKFKKPRPILEAGFGMMRRVMPLLPEEARDAVEAMRAVARTTPLFWKVEPRE